MHAQKHWITEYREARGLTVETLALEIRKKTKRTVSVALLCTLESGGITHPEIARCIAKATGATGAQYNAIVAKQHWGKYRRREEKEQPRDDSRDILAIGPDGRIVGEYTGFKEAAEANGKLGELTVASHCRKKRKDNFLRYGCAFRFREDFTSEERKRLMRIADRQLNPITDLAHVGINDIVSANGEAHTVRDWAILSFKETSTIINRLRAGGNPNEILKRIVK